MKIICDPPKRAANIIKHMLDLGSVTEVFFEGAKVQPAKAGRFMAIGML